MLEICNKKRKEFLDEFNYLPEASFEAVMQEQEASEKYCEVLQKCIDDEFDYTIELYGTKPPKNFGGSEILID
ncbi:MAG: hypothetical protein R3Y58_08625 [Eubacteriales bacterium]